MKKKLKKFFATNPSRAYKAKTIAKKLNFTEPHEYEELKAFLHDLVQEGYLTRVGKRFRLKEITKRVTGTLQISADNNFGFVIPDNPKIKDIFIAEKHLGTAFDGDIVEVHLFAKRKGKNPEGEIVNIIKRAKNEITGILRKTDSFYFVEPDNKKIYRDIYIPRSKLGGAKIGDKVVVSGIKWNSHLLNPEGQIIDVIGKAGTYDTEMYSIAKEFDLRYKFPPKVLSDAAKIPVEINPAEIKNRLDLRKKNIFTIDPETAKDFDDAVSVEFLKNGNYLVGIHIADVSHYVRPGTSIFKEAYKRSTSVYLVGKVIPMLPEKLSNQVCSLVPNEDRLTYSVIVEMTPSAKLVNYQIRKTVIKSKRRFTYEEVQKIIDNRKGEFKKEILTLNELAQTLRKKREAKGSINFVKPEVEFVLNKKGDPIDVKIKKIQESNNLIEEFMLLANRIVARHVNLNKRKHNYPFVYRIHDLPDEEKLAEFASFVKSLGYSFTPNAANSSKEMQRLLKQVKGTPEEAVINEVAIRSMAKAVYSPDNIGHYGLGFRYYTHFTSPIRRFPDLIVHLQIFEYIEHNKRKLFNYHQLEEYCDHASAQERSAVNAERLSVKLKQMEFLRNKLGEEFVAVISGVTNFGLFVELEDTLAEGLVSIRDMDDDFYIFDEKNYTLYGKRKGKKYRLGDKVNVKLIRIDEDKREIDFILS